MNINSIFANQTTSALNFSASQFQSANTGQSFSSVMASMTQNTNNLAFKASGTRTENVTPYVSQAFLSASSIPGKTAASNAPVEPFDINKYYPPDTANTDLTYRIFYAEKKFTNGFFGSVVDYSGMTDLQIYEKIESWFIEEFGENFMMGYSLNTPGKFAYSDCGEIAFSIPGLGHIGQGFNRIVYKALGSQEKVWEVRRNRLFGDATDDEIHDTIRAKYPETLTYRDLLLMYCEMDSVGLFKSDNDNWLPQGRAGYNARSIKDYAYSYAFFHPDIPWEENINKPINLPYIFGAYNIWQWQGNYVASPALQQFMTRTLGGQFDDRGWLIGGVMPWDQYGGRFNVDEEDLDKDNISKPETPDLLSQFLAQIDKHILKTSNNKI